MLVLQAHATTPSAANVRVISVSMREETRHRETAPHEIAVEGVLIRPNRIKPECTGPYEEWGEF